jgi:hypothetical protein
VLLALDCEMCATSASDKELLQVAVVDQDGRQLMKVRQCSPRYAVLFVHLGQVSVLLAAELNLGSVVGCALFGMYSSKRQGAAADGGGRPGRPPAHEGAATWRI